MDHSSESRHPARNIDILLARYGDSHQDHTNEIIHFVCIPLIVFSLLGILWAIHPVVALAVTLASLYYYLKLSRGFALGMGAMSAAMLAVLALMPAMTVLPVSIAVFVVSWIGQFIGHKIEGRRPSFFTDMSYLLVGPMWTLGKLYRKLGWSY